jgi:predicted RNA binding protein YcfA (HicA-like mRNA interferase family)
MTKNQLMKIRKTKDFIKVLESEYGYHKDGQESSHMKYRAEGRPPLSIVESRELSNGTKRNLINLILGDSYYSKG